MDLHRDAATYLALLVHKGIVAEAVARDALARREPEEPLPSLLARCGALPLEEAERLWANKVGEEPRLTRYAITERLGSGATAIVFAASDSSDGAEVALKVLREEVARQPAKLARFVEEARLLCRLSHPHLVAGKRVAKDRGTVFLAMERLPGVTLEERLLDGHRFGEIEALRIVHQVADCLAYLRSEGLVHRDLKPGNMMLGDDGRVRLIDLGFAARIGGTEDSAVTVGTVEYIAPEQARGEAGLDARADIYSLGATLYHLVVGEPPFAGEDNQEVLLKQVMAEISSAKIKALDLSPQLHYFIEKMMAKDRDIRFQAPEDVVRDLDEKLGDALKPRIERSRPTRVRRALKRRRRR